LIFQQCYLHISGLRGKRELEQWPISQNRPKIQRIFWYACKFVCKKCI